MVNHVVVLITLIDEKVGISQPADFYSSLRHLMDEDSSKRLLPFWPQNLPGTVSALKH